MYTPILSSFIIAMVFAILLSYVFQRNAPGPLNGLLFIFLILFIFSWAIGSWISPINQFHQEFPWLSYLIIALAVMLLMGTLLPANKKKSHFSETNSPIEQEIQNDQVISLTINFFFWIFILTLLIIGILRWA